jgi:hypothetical protein
MLHARLPLNRCWIPRRVKRLALLNLPDRIWGSPSFTFIVYQHRFPYGFRSAWGVVLTTHSHLVSRFRMSDYVFSLVSIATRYGLDGPRIKSQWGRVFPHLSTWGPANLFYNGYRIYFQEGKTVRAWRWPPTPSSVQVKERVKLYHCSLSGPSSPVLGWNLPFRCLHIMHSGNSSLYGLSHRCFIPLCLLLQRPINL